MNATLTKREISRTSRQQLVWFLCCLQLAFISSVGAFHPSLPLISPPSSDHNRFHPLRAVTESSSYTDPSAALPPAISVDTLSCTHNGGETWQVKDVSFVLAQGAKAALIGINGSGKFVLRKSFVITQCQSKSTRLLLKCLCLFGKRKIYLASDPGGIYLRG